MYSRYTYVVRGKEVPDWTILNMLSTNMQLTARTAMVVTTQYRAQATHVSLLDQVFGEYSTRMPVDGADFRRRQSLTLGGLKEAVG